MEPLPEEEYYEGYDYEDYDYGDYDQQWYETAQPDAKRQRRGQQRWVPKQSTASSSHQQWVPKQTENPEPPHAVYDSSDWQPTQVPARPSSAEK